MKRKLSVIVFLLLFNLSAFSSDDVMTLASPDRLWQGIPGIERTENGRLFFTWFSGGKKEPTNENEVYLCYSDDDGETHSPLQIMAAPKNGARAFDPVPWIDPKGRLWYLYNRGNKASGLQGVYARICDEPDAEVPVFGPETYIGFDCPYSFRLNKPIVLSTGEWVMPVTHIQTWVPKKTVRQQTRYEGAAVSADEGKTWKLYGEVHAPPWALESMIVELKDGRLWMLIRTGKGVLYQSFSSDKGRTWSKSEATKIENPGSRFFIRRLASGNLLLVNHYDFDGRSHLTAQLSTDDGKSWNKGLLLDPRKFISYPDGVQDKDGNIWIIYDRDRNDAGDILMAKFREEDAAARKKVSGTVQLREVIDSLKNPKPEAKR